jgi:hypothetical protein
MDVPQEFVEVLRIKRVGGMQKYAELGEKAQSRPYYETPPRFSRWYFNFTATQLDRIHPLSYEVEVPPTKARWPSMSKY